MTVPAQKTESMKIVQIIIPGINLKCMHNLCGLKTAGSERIHILRPKTLTKIKLKILEMEHSVDKYLLLPRKSPHISQRVRRKKA